MLRKYRTVIFVNGCFWHGHEGCRYFVLPKTRTDFWQAKIERNRERDLAERLQLRRMGWHVIQVWECQLKPKNREQTLQGLALTLNHIFLQNCSVSKAKPYGEQEEGDGMSMAAEEKSEY